MLFFMKGAAGIRYSPNPYALSLSLSGTIWGRFARTFRAVKTDLFEKVRLDMCGDKIPVGKRPVSYRSCSNRYLAPPGIKGNMRCIHMPCKGRAIVL